MEVIKMIRVGLIKEGMISEVREFADMEAVFEFISDAELEGLDGVARLAGDAASVAVGEVYSNHVSGVWLWLPRVMGWTLVDDTDLILKTRVKLMWESLEPSIMQTLSADEILTNETAFSERRLEAFVLTEATRINGGESRDGKH